jgi:hypothetical protein
MKYGFLGAAIALTMATGAAFADCDKLPGTVHYADDFADDLGGWDYLAGAADLQPPVMALTPTAGDNVSIAVLVQTFWANDGTYCADIALPPAPPGNRVAAGLIFWAKDYNNYNLFQIDTEGQISLWRLSDSGWTSLVPLTRAEALNLSPGALNELVVKVEGTTLTLMLNGLEVRKLRAQAPGGEPKFGLYAQVDTKGTLATPVTVPHFRVMAP